ncbi:WD40-repeat-containing domain protein [Aspergillus alliaceus]|uniref:WD40-repeat-containing domain protein n=1 Tax=Petromyces alliaceus TaxID=209559 RepID=UPI0012A7250F|nr:WD40-repeat-containing domain protein [Aspergillus alliaceus]KAB8238710.1 WD40-repeat-containing domain protein [Aspergillus alliaceus]
MASRNRFRLHNLFHRPNNPQKVNAQTGGMEIQKSGSINGLLLVSSPGKSNSHSNQPTQYSEPTDLWSAAYNQLGDEERRILSTITIPRTPTERKNLPQTALLISEVIQLTEKQYQNHQQRADKRLRESFQKIINAALSFKDIVDAVVAFDPTYHAASAWAIVSLGLTVAQNHHDLQVALFESSEYLADVLAQCAYIEDQFYINGDGGRKRDLGNAMIRLYRAILHYTAQIRTAQDPSTGRKLLDCVTAIIKHPLSELRASVEKERDNIARSRSILDRVDEVLESMQLLTEQFNLANLCVAKGALYNSYDNQHDDFCLLDTRTELRSQITEWAESSESKIIFWLNGMAGTGKSTIARTAARAFEEKQQLGATFFFKKGEADRGDAKHRQLAPGVLKAIRDDSDISAKSLREQFDKLLLQPLSNLISTDSTTTIIVIDALDECKSEDIPKSKVLHVRIFLTSRPEIPVHLDLHDLPNPVIEEDIRIFLKERLSVIRKNREMTDDWPGEESLHTLVEMAVPLFIFAATACRFIEQGRHPERRLKQLLAAQAVTTASQMDKIYQPVLTQLLTDNDDESTGILQEFQDIVGVIINLATPLTVDSLTQLLHLPKRTISDILDPLHSVLNISSDTEAPVRILHLSFREYLLTTENRFHVDEQVTHRKIGLHCLRVMSDGLRHNICGLPSYGTERDNISRQLMNQHLSAALQYSCRYWVHHLQQSKCCISEFPILHFLKTQFLHWLEALSLMGVLFEIVGMIDTLQALAVKNTDNEISEFLYDARRFILRNSSIASTAPLQLYCSGLIFSPRKSIVRKVYSDKIPNWICPLPQMEATWSSNLQILTGHSYWVNTVAFSPDGSTLASGSADTTIKVWDVNTGKELQTLTGHSNMVMSVAFSPDGSILASGSADTTLELWDVKAGKKLQTLVGHSDQVISVAFSPDGSTLASGSADTTLILWDVKAGKELQKLAGHLNKVTAVAFSPNGSTLASGADDRTIRLWDVKAGKELQTLTGHSEPVASVAFSPDGSTLASGSAGDTITLWHIKGGKELQTLTGHWNAIESVAFSPDGSTLASGSLDRTIRLWDVKAGKELQTLTGHSSWVSSVAFSPDGSTLASGSADDSIALWHIKAGKDLQALTGHSDQVDSVAFSPDGSTLASGSLDRTIRLWDVKAGKELQTLTGHSSWVSSVAFSPDGSTLASSSADNTIKLWDVKAGKELQTLTGHLAQAGKELQTLTGHSDQVTFVTFSPDGLILASGSADTTLILWDVKAGKELQTLTGHSNKITSIAFSPDILMLASGSADTTLTLWDVKAGKELQTLTGHSGWVSSVAFSPDGSTLASGANDRTIKLWDVKAGKELQTVTGHPHLDWSAANSSPTAGHYIPFSHRNNNPSQFQVSLSGNWVSMAGEKLVCLPPDYPRHSCSAVNGATIALGYEDGRLLIIGFHAP